MEALRKTYEKLGFSGVTTYIQSGNVIFRETDHKPQLLSQRIAHQIKTDFGFDVKVLVLTIEAMKEIIHHNPFVDDPARDPTFLHVTFLAEKPGNFDMNAIKEKKQGGEEIAFTDRAIYLYCPHGYGKTRLGNNFLEARLKVTATTRNWKTTKELYKIAKEISS